MTPTERQKKKLLKDLRAMLDHVLEEAVKEGQGLVALREAMAVLSGDKPFLAITGFRMHNHNDGYVEVLAEHAGKWVTVFGTDGPGPVARDEDQVIDHAIHGGGIANLRDYGHLYGGNTVTPARPARKKKTRSKR